MIEIKTSPLSDGEFNRGYLQHVISKRRAFTRSTCYFLSKRTAPIH